MSPSVPEMSLLHGQESVKARQCVMLIPVLDRRNQLVNAATIFNVPPIDRHIVALRTGTGNPTVFGHGTPSIAWGFGGRGFPTLGLAPLLLFTAGLMLSFCGKGIRVSRFGMRVPLGRLSLAKTTVVVVCKCRFITARSLKNARASVLILSNFIHTARVHCHTVGLIQALFH